MPGSLTSQRPQNVRVPATNSSQGVGWQTGPPPRPQPLLLRDPKCKLEFPQLARAPAPTLGGSEHRTLLDPEFCPERKLKDPNLPPNHAGFVCQGPALRDLEPRPEPQHPPPLPYRGQAQHLHTQIPLSMQDLYCVPDGDHPPRTLVPLPGTSLSHHGL